MGNEASFGVNSVGKLKKSKFYIGTPEGAERKTAISIRKSQFLFVWGGCPFV